MNIKNIENHDSEFRQNITWGGREPTLDIAKGIAMLMVILVHSTQRIDNLMSVFNIFKLGQLGCQLFFVVSGYLVMKNAGKDTLKNYYIKRYSSMACYLSVITM